MALETESSVIASTRSRISSSSKRKESEVSWADNKSEHQGETKEIEQLLPNTTIVTHCILKNDPHRFNKCFEDEGDPYRDDIAELLNERDKNGRSPLDIAAKLGRVQLTKDLIARGADVNDCSPTGYSCLHFAAAWGCLKVLKIHIESGGSVQHKNNHGERPRETALRYSQLECVAFLERAESKALLQQTIHQTQEIISDPDKSVAGRISKEEKNIALNTCKEKQEWMDNAPDATTEDFIAHRMSLNEICSPIIQKMSEPPPEKVSAPQKTKKKGK